MTKTAFTARFIFPISGPPLEDAAVLVDDEQICHVGRGVPAGAKVVDLNELHPSGGVAILPGLVNAHTHLEFSDFEQPLGEPGMAFADWIRRIIAHRRQKSQEEDGPSHVRRAMERGIDQSLRCGVTTIGEINTQDELLDAYNTSPACVIAFREFLGLTDAAVNQARARAQSAVGSIFTSGRWAMGVSPHAPYSTHMAIVKLLCDVSRTMKLPLAMHLAESPEELELLQSHRGPFRALLEDLGVWNADAIPHGGKPMDYLQQLANADRSLVIHGNYLSDEEIAFCGQHRERMSVVYCPRTHAYFPHQPYPLAKMLAAGVNVALGTDSRASNPDLNLWSEMRHAAEHHPDVSPETILKMATIGPALALGLAQRIGTLQPGKQADLAVVAVGGESGDPYQMLLDARTTNVATICGGNRVV